MAKSGGWIPTPFPTQTEIDGRVWGCCLGWALETLVLLSSRCLIYLSIFDAWFEEPDVVQGPKAIALQGCSEVEYCHTVQTSSWTAPPT